LSDLPCLPKKSSFLTFLWKIFKRKV